MRLGCFIGINKGMSHGGFNNYIKSWRKSSSPQKNCNGVGLGEEAFDHLAQPYKHETRQQVMSHMATLAFVILLYAIISSSKTTETGLLLSAMMFLN